MSAVEDRKIARALELNTWLGSPGAELRALVRARAAVRRYAPGQWVFAEGEASGGLHIIVDGTLQLFVQVVGGREVLLSQIGCGRTVGQSSRLGAGPPLSTAISLTDSMTLHLSEDVLGALAEEHPLIWPALANFHYLQMKSMIQAMAEFISLPAAHRLAARLAWLVARQGDLQDLTVSQQALAEMLGLSRKTVNANLADLERKGIVRRSYGVIEVVDLPGLRTVAATPSLGG